MYRNTLKIFIIILFIIVFSKNNLIFGNNEKLKNDFHINNNRYSKHSYNLKSEEIKEKKCDKDEVYIEKYDVCCPWNKPIYYPEKELCFPVLP